MLRIWTLATLMALGIGTANRPAEAAEIDRTCLTPSAAQEAVYAGQARRLSEVRDGLDGELIRADLCRNGSAYVYVITTLGKNGKVKRQVLDASPSPSVVAPVRSNGY